MASFSHVLIQLVVLLHNAHIHKASKYEFT